MKKSILLVASLMLFLGSGCDSFLDETNYSDVTSEGGYYDKQEVEVAPLDALNDGVLFCQRMNELYELCPDRKSVV